MKVFIRKKKKPLIVGLGACYVDHIVVPENPDALTQQGRLKDYKCEGGGPASTAIVAASRLGARGRILTALGKDHNALIAREEFKRHHVDVSWVRIVPQSATSVSLIIVHPVTGERYIHLRPGKGLRQVDFKSGDIEKADALLVDGFFHDATLKLLKHARKHGIPCVGDLGRATRQSKKIAKFLDYLIVPASFTKATTQRGLKNTLQAIHKLGARFAAVTLGEKGCIYSDNGCVEYVEAFRLKKVVDTTGAGDVFHGAFTFGLTQGWPVHACVRFAQAVSAIKCTRMGGRSGIPDFEETLRFLKKENLV